MTQDPARQDQPEEGRAFEPIDFLLKQGDRDELRAMRQAIGDDPMLALELADTVDVVEQFRQLRTEPSPRYACKLAGLSVRAERLLHPVKVRRTEAARRPRRMPWVGLLAAAGTFVGLVLLEPFDCAPTQAPSGRSYAFHVREDAAPTDPRPQPMLRAEADWQEAIDVIGNRLALERSPRLRAAFEEGLQQGGDPLSQWLDPRNAMVLLRLDHELRANARNRARALEEHGGLAAADARVQQLADGIANELLARRPDDAAGEAWTEQQLREVAYGVRALIAAGSTSQRVRALREGGDLLADHLPELHGARLVTALTGLIELATVSGAHFEAVAEHGGRLVAEVLLPDEERWARSRPELLTGRVAAGTLGEAARIVARLPAFGVDIERCRLTRRLILGQLREQRDVGQDRPEVLAAMLYGCGDLLDTQEEGGERVRERERLHHALRRWKPARLAPDFVTVQQLAWSLRPGDRGFTRRQWELRELAVLPVPEDLQARAAFCLCLATNYAGFVGALVPSADGPRGS